MAKTKEYEYWTFPKYGDNHLYCVESNCNFLTKVLFYNLIEAFNNKPLT